MYSRNRRAGRACALGEVIVAAQLDGGGRAVAREELARRVRRKRAALHLERARRGRREARAVSGGALDAIRRQVALGRNVQRDRRDDALREASRREPTCALVLVAQVVLSRGTGARSDPVGLAPVAGYGRFDWRQMVAAGCERGVALIAGVRGGEGGWGGAVRTESRSMSRRRALFGRARTKEDRSSRAAKTFAP